MSLNDLYTAVRIIHLDFRIVFRVVTDELSIPCAIDSYYVYRIMGIANWFRHSTQFHCPIKISPQRGDSSIHGSADRNANLRKTLAIQLSGNNDRKNGCIEEDFRSGTDYRNRLQRRTSGSRRIAVGQVSCGRVFFSSEPSISSRIIRVDVTNCTPLENNNAADTLVQRKVDLLLDRRRDGWANDRRNIMQ